MSSVHEVSLVRLKLFIYTSHHSINDTAHVATVHTVSNPEYQTIIPIQLSFVSVQPFEMFSLDPYDMLVYR